MAIQLAVTTRNARLDAIETDAGATVKLSIRTGTQPANCAAADAGNLVMQITLPADYMNDASGGQKTLKGSWSGTATGTMIAAGHFRLYKNDGTTCIAQGIADVAGAGVDMVLDNNNVAIGQVLTVNTFTLTDANS
jgi:hypothetical protein